MSVTGERDGLPGGGPQMAGVAITDLVTGSAPGRLGNAHPNIVPCQVFACADGHLNLAVGNDGQFARFCESAGVAGWAADPRFARNSDRVRYGDTLVPMVAEVVKAKGQHEWLALLEPLGVPCGPINPIDRVFDKPKLAARGMKLDLPHPLASSVPQVGFSLLLAGSVPQVGCPQLLGQRTGEELKARPGYDDARIAALVAAVVVGVR